MNNEELDAWVEKTQAAISGNTARIRYQTDLHTVTDVTGEMAVLLQRYQEMRSSSPASDRDKAFCEAERMVDGVLRTSSAESTVVARVAREFQSLRDSYCFDTLRDQARGLRERADEKWAKGNKVASQQLHNEAAKLETRITDALRHETRRGR